MGTFDTVVNEASNIEIQIKSTKCEMNTYKLGDEIELPDGCHIGYGGYFIVCSDIRIHIGKNIYDKWGGIIDINEVISSINPIYKIIKNSKKGK